MSCFDTYFLGQLPHDPSES